MIPFVYPTIAEILEIPSVARGRPIVRAGRNALDTPIRWVHVNEQQNPAGALTGGELILSIGVPTSDPTTNLLDYVSTLKSAGAAGLMIEIGQHLQALPAALVQHARALSFPLIELRQSVRFVDVTEAVHGIILNQHYARLEFTERVARVFRGLAVNGATTEQVVTQAAELLGLPIVLEDLGHRALCFAGGNPAEVLRAWVSLSRETPGVESGDGPRGWEVAPVGRRDDRWGRLVVAARKTGDDRVPMVLAHASDTLTILRLTDPRTTPIQEASDKLLTDLLESSPIPSESLLARARALDLGGAGPYVVLVFSTPPSQTAHLTDRITEAARSARIAAVVGKIAEDRVAAVVSGGITASADTEATEQAVQALLARLDGAAAYTQSANLAGLPDALAEASYIAVVIKRGAAAPARRLWKYADLGVHALLWNLRSDSRLLTFVDEQLAPILQKQSDEQRQQLLKSLRAYVSADGVVSTFARLLGLSRQAAYARVEKLSGELGKDLTDPDSRLALHLALLALDLVDSDDRRASIGERDSRD